MISIEDVIKVNDDVYFYIEVKLPIEQVKKFAENMTGHDDDIVLAGEKAMREILEADALSSELELDTVCSDLKDHLLSIAEKAGV